MGDEVADRDRQQARARRGDADEPGDQQRGRDEHARKTTAAAVASGTLRGAEQVEVGLRLRQAVEQDRAGRRGRRARLGDRPARLQQAATRTDAGATRSSSGSPARRTAPAGRAAGTRRRTSRRAPPGVAPELGHHRERERGVADQHDEQRPRAAPVRRARARRTNDEADHRRPAAERRRDTSAAAQDGCPAGAAPPPRCRGAS